MHDNIETQLQKTAGRRASHIEGRRTADWILMDYVDFVIHVFLILPVKVKWLALIAWIFYALAFVGGDLAAKLAVIAATGNFLIFFGRDMWMRLWQRKRRIAYQAANRAQVAEYSRHRCKVCGKDSETHGDLDFRYCSTCTDDSCYCPEHIRNHEHVTTPPNEPEEA